VAAALIGRRTELDVIEGVLDGARAGRAGVMVVRGVAGVGKSALLSAFAGASGFRVLRAEGVEGEAELAYAGLHQLLRPVMGLVGRRPAVQRAALEAAFGLAPGAGDRFLVAAATLGLLADAAEESPLLCIVDDLQWLDQASAAALVFAARRLDAERIALLLGMRSGAAGPPGVERFPSQELGGLERDDAARLLDGLPPADRRRILDAADGIPLALLELPRGPGASLGALERTFADRIAALPEDTRAAVLVAAADDDAEGRTALRALAACEGARTAVDDDARFAAGPAAAVAARDGLAALAPAEADGLLWASGDRLVFRHPLVRSAAYSSATFAERRRAHTALAGALPGEADADRRAWHRAAALEAPDDSVAEELERSAERARLRGGHAAAAAALERSARLTAEDTARARRLVGAAGASHLAGDAEHALRLAGEVLALSGDELIAAEAAGIRGAINAHRGASEDAEADLLRAARAVAQSDATRALRFALAAGETALLGGRYERTAEIADWARTLADADAADLVAGLAHLYARRPAAAAPHFKAARERAELAGDPQFLIWAGAGTFYGGDIDRARLTYMRAVAAARERGAAGLVAFGLPLVAMFELIEGRFTQARADRERRPPARTGMRRGGRRDAPARPPRLARRGPGP
jgi:hypothetical protein